VDRPARKCKTFLLPDRPHFVTVEPRRTTILAVNSICALPACPICADSKVLSRYSDEEQMHNPGDELPQALTTEADGVVSGSGYA